MYIAEHLIGRHVTVNHWVGGSIPSRGAMQIKALQRCGLLFCNAGRMQTAFKANPSDTRDGPGEAIRQEDAFRVAP